MKHPFAPAPAVDGEAIGPGAASDAASVRRTRSKQEFSTRKLADMIPTEADAYLLLESLRWGSQPPAELRSEEEILRRMLAISPEDAADVREQASEKSASKK